MRWYRARDYSSDLECVRYLVSELDLSVSVEHELIGFDFTENTDLCEMSSVAGSYRFDGIILGQMSTMDYPAVSDGGRNVSGGFRVGLDLYANVRPAKSRPSIQSKARGWFGDLQENTEGFYPDQTCTEGG